MKKLFKTAVFSTVIGILFTASVLANSFTIGQNGEWGDPNKSFDEVSEEVNYGIKIDDQNYNWLEGIDFTIPNELEVYTRMKQKTTIVNPELTYIVIKAGAEPAGGGNWVYRIADGEVEIIKFPLTYDENYIVFVNENIIFIIQVEGSKDISNVSFFFIEGEGETTTPIEETTLTETSETEETNYITQPRDNVSILALITAVISLSTLLVIKKIE